MKENRTIAVDSHALFRLSQNQRKIYKPQDLIFILKEETPVLVGLQKNGAYSAFFSRKDKYVRIVFKVGENIKIITFYHTETLPKA